MSSDTDSDLDPQCPGRSYIDDRQVATRSTSDRHFATTAVTESQVMNAQYDFISLLAIAQKLEIDLLAITWQSTREVIGIGGTAKINQALVNLQTSFAFKRIKEEDKAKPELIFREVINEMIVLSHPAIQRHPNIVELQGLCWDIPSDDKVWPVLVLEKSHFGDLYEFLRLPVGRDLSTNERLELCLNIGIAIADMHSNGTKCKA